MGVNKTYWTGMDELHQTEAYQESVNNEFPVDQSANDFLGQEDLKETSTPRRDFLKFMGFSVTAATLAACEAPVIKSIPYINRPAEIVPGVANYYASTYYDGNDYGNILVKTREGRPIFIKPNKAYGEGAINARINSSVISLYDEERLRGPGVNGVAKTWKEIDSSIASELSSVSNVKVLSNTVISPSSQKAIDDFCTKFNAEHIQYDAISYSGLRQANGGVIPRYDFSKARTVVSIAADFTGTWLTPNVFHSQFAETRKPENTWMSQHFQFESNMSLTGSNADYRQPIRPSEEGKVAAALYNVIKGKASGLEGKLGAMVDKAGKKLKSNMNKGASLVVAGSNDINVQKIVAEINRTLGNEGVTVDAENGINFFQGNDAKVSNLVKDMNSGAVGALIVYGVNPAYSLANADQFVSGLKKVGTTISFNSHADETTSQCKYACPDNHYLESWNDFTPHKGRTDIAQPAIRPLFNTRQAQETLLKWAGNDISYYNYIRTNHDSGYTEALKDFNESWNKAVMTGTKAGSSSVATLDTDSQTVEAVEQVEAPIASASISSAISAVNSAKSGNWEVKLYEKIGMGAGNHASNPYLQELPDPLTKVTWDNYITMSPADMMSKELNIGDHIYLGQRVLAAVATVTVNGKSVSLPVVPQPGQAHRTIGIALGFGRGAGNEKIGRAAYQTGDYGDYLLNEDGTRVTIGSNVFGFVSESAGNAVYSNSAEISITGDTYKIANTQMHSTVMGRDSIVKETTLDTFSKEKNKPKGEASYNMMLGLVVHHDVNGDHVLDARDKESVREFDLWEQHSIEEVGHRWGMSIDLSACDGCSACVTACHIENNVPVVGKDEVHRHRDMHWMRIDRYYSSELENIKEAKKQGLSKIKAYAEMENPEDNPQTVHMPMMCQHCNHAPCETVCPVAATTHSSEGLNQMTYNRCIGTRYCANNCPYKVRRFNWFNYQAYKKFKHINVSQHEIGRMVLNPDVTVRARGVMEKCSMCVQRIQEGKLEAKKASTPVADGSIVTACAEACPTNAITFGDLNDKNAEVTKLSKDNRAYNALEEVGVQPNMYYQTIVRNKDKA